MKNQENKDQYVRPVVEIIKFDSEDVITTSGLDVNLPEDNIIWGAEE